MTISLPGSKKRGLAGLFGRKPVQTAKKPTARKQLEGAQVAQLFNKSAPRPEDLKPAKMNASERNEHNNLSVLRGALYVKK